MALFLDDVKVGGIKELCAALDLPLTDIPSQRRTKEFEQIMDRDIHGNPKRDQDGNYVTKRKIAGSPTYSILVPSKGYEVRVRLAQTQRKEKDGFVYTPAIITMDPAEDGSTVVNDPLEFAFWYLHPWNLQSPFHQINTPAYFEFKDNDAKSKTDNDNEENMINALGYIVGRSAQSIKQLRSIAKGLNVLGVDDMTDDVVKKTLRDIAKRNPLEFINKVESREIIFSGQIQDAIDKGILKTQNVNGMVRWYLNDKEILPVPYGTDQVSILKDELSAKWYLYSKEIQDSLSSVTVSENLSNPKQDEVFMPLVNDKIEQLADLTPEQRVYLKKMQDEAWFDEKIKKLATIDPNDVTVHFQTKKSYENNLEAIEAYRASLAVVEVPA